MIDKYIDDLLIEKHKNINHDDNSLQLPLYLDLEYYENYYENNKQKTEEKEPKRVITIEL